MFYMKRSQFVTLVVIYVCMAVLLAIDPPFFVQFAFVLACISYAAWCFFTVFRGPDEVQSAHARYALAFASGTSVPLCLTFVTVMVATPSLQNLIASLATNTRSDLLPTAAGFGMGVMFTLSLMVITFIIGLTIWWASKR
ncbi:hypothetical protein [Labrenzia sp. CE80]|uniref:hypothetical protein n=1 Tax=Labrenzia sp. CE80 TaxID=1788986 RepID=UPI00129B3BD0|nr:hypothetical protein [Labrenzia sp. CE80]